MDNKVLFFKGQTVIPPNNTFIGGVSATINTPALLAAKLGNYLNSAAFSESAIYNFTIVGADIECYIGVYFTTQPIFDSNCTYFKHNDLYYIYIQYNSFINNNNFKYLEAKNAIKSSSSVFGGNNQGSVKIAYLPNVIDYGNSVIDDGVFKYLGQPLYSLMTIYAHPSMATINSGGVEGDLAYAISRGCDVRYVTNFTAPNAVTDLAVDTVYATAIKLSWTEPSNINGIDFYEIYVDGVLDNTSKNLTGSAVGLTNLATYNFTVIAVDNFYNKSLVSNTVTQQINGSGNWYDSNLLAYYRFNSDLIDQINAYNGTGTAITYVAGKSGNAASFNGSTSKIVILDNPDFSFTSGGGVDKPFTISSYLKSNSTADQMFINKLKSRREFYVFYLSEKIKVSLESSAGNSIYVETSSAVNITTLKHLVITYDASKTKEGLNIYINGVLQVVTRVSSGTYAGMPNGSDNLVIGQHGNETNILVWNGLIDGLGIFNKELSQAEITDIYNIQNAGNELI